MEHNRQFHINERPIICDICGESFTRNQQYQVHLQNHDKNKETEEPRKSHIFTIGDCYVKKLILTLLQLQNMDVSNVE